MNLLLLFIVAMASCGGGSTPDPTPPPPPPPPPADVRYPAVNSPAMPAARPGGEIIPDFSRVGYRWGDAQIPSVAVWRELDPPAGGADATAIIQQAITDCPGGAIVLKAGTWNVSGQIRITKSNVVLRGQGRDPANGGTLLVATGTTQRALIVIGTSASNARSATKNSAYAIKDDYVPAGQFWVRSPKASEFRVGDNVVIYRPSPQNWITDLKMDQIPPRTDGLPITQWQAGKYDTWAERVITFIDGDTLHFDNPVVITLDKNYGGGQVVKYTYPNRISECGVENMAIHSDYVSDTDEEHGWNAIEVYVAEHCWIRGITSRYFGMGLASLEKGAKNITVENCTCLDPKSKIEGSRRYSYHIPDGQICLIKNCSSDKARHDYATGSLNCGPNVFTGCTATNTYADIGPHQRWNSGTLYDRVISNGEICIQDRSNYGSGHGWAAVTNVLWNCTGSLVIVQSPWVSGCNYSIGTIGTKSPGKFTSPPRPDGVWASQGSNVSPASLYEAQLTLRRTNQPGGVMDTSKF